VASDSPPPPFPSLSLIALIVANCTPIFGVLFLRWDIFLILAAYWAENVVIAFYNVLRIQCVDRALKFSPGKAFVIALFLTHYGGFTFLHGTCLLLMFGSNASPAGEDLLSMLGAIWPEIREMLAVRLRPLIIMSISLFASHGVSFVLNYLLRGERRRVRFEDLMFRPYRRIVVMHLTVVLGGILVGKTGAHQAALCLLVALKITLDVIAHRREHKRPTSE